MIPRTTSMLLRKLQKPQLENQSQTLPRSSQAEYALTSTIGTVAMRLELSDELEKEGSRRLAARRHHMTKDPVTTKIPVRRNAARSRCRSPAPTARAFFSAEPSGGFQSLSNVSTSQWEQWLRRISTASMRDRQAGAVEPGTVAALSRA